MPQDTDPLAEMSAMDSGRLDAEQRELLQVALQTLDAPDAARAFVDADLGSILNHAPNVGFYNQIPALVDSLSRAPDLMRQFLNKLCYGKAAKLINPGDLETLRQALARPPQVPGAARLTPAEIAWQTSARIAYQLSRTIHWADMQEQEGAYRMLAIDLAKKRTPLGVPPVLAIVNGQFDDHSDAFVARMEHDFCSKFESDLGVQASKTLVGGQRRVKELLFNTRNGREDIIERLAHIRYQFLEALSPIEDLRATKDPDAFKSALSNVLERGVATTGIVLRVPSTGFGKDDAEVLSAWVSQYKHLCETTQLQAVFHHVIYFENAGEAQREAGLWARLTGGFKSPFDKMLDQLSADASVAVLPERIPLGWVHINDWAENKHVLASANSYSPPEISDFRYHMSKVFSATQEVRMRPFSDVLDNFPKSSKEVSQ